MDRVIPWALGLGNSHLDLETIQTQGKGGNLKLIVFQVILRHLLGDHTRTQFLYVQKLNS